MDNYESLNYCFVDKEFYYRFFSDYLNIPEYAVCPDAFKYEITTRYHCDAIGPFHQFLENEEKSSVLWLLHFKNPADYTFFLLEHGDKLEK